MAPCKLILRPRLIVISSLYHYSLLPTFFSEELNLSCSCTIYFYFITRDTVWSWYSSKTLSFHHMKFHHSVNIILRFNGWLIDMSFCCCLQLCVLHLGSPLLNFGALLDYESLNQLGLVIGVYVSWVQIMRNIVRYECY